MHSDHASHRVGVRRGSAAAAGARERAAAACRWPAPTTIRAAGAGVGAGDFVVVPLGKREAVGVVWGDGAGDVAPKRS